MTGAGGTGGSGAGGAGAAIGTNGANGAVGAVGAQGTAVQGMDDDADYALSMTPKTAKTSQTAADPAGEIYIAGTVHTDSCSAGTGGSKDTTRAEDASTFLDRETVTLQEFFTYTLGVKYNNDITDTPHPITVYFTKARMGGNGGAGGAGAVFGQGGGGGGGGGGGESASMAHPWSGKTTYYTEVTHPGDDGDDVTATPNDTKQTLNTADTTKVPYSTVTFTGADSNETQNYYLQNSTGITVPGYTPAEVNKIFKGWKVTTPAAALPAVFGETASRLLDTDTNVYQPGEKITATGIYGNVVLEAVLEDAAYNITTGNCTVEKTKAYKGDTVAITGHDDRLADYGEDFDCYVVTKADDASVTVALNADGDSFTMPDYDVKVTAAYKPHAFTVTALDGTVIEGGTLASGKMSATAHKGDKVVLALNQNDIPQGESFADFAVTKVGASGAAGTVDVVQDAAGSYYFIMPASDVTVKVVTKADNYTITTTLCSKVTINGADAPQAASAAAHYNDEVVVTANTPVTGSDLIGFTVLQTGGAAVAGTSPDLTGGTVTFRMPSSNVTVTAKYSLHNYIISVDDGTVSGNVVRQGDGTYATTYGELLTLAANSHAGQELEHFEVIPSDPAVTVTVAADGTFTMPACDLTIKVHYRNIGYTVDAQDNTGYTIESTTGKTTPEAGDTVKITAENREERGYRFAGFEVTDANGILIACEEDRDARTGSFTMPADNVTVKPKYTKINYSVSVRGGALAVNGGTPVYGATAQVDDKVAFTADAPADGETFTGWEFTADGVPTTVEIEGGKTADDEEIVVVMPPQNLVATATYSNSLYSVYVDDTEVTQAQKNAVVTIEAPTKQGCRFAGWQTDDLPDLTDGQKQNPSLTFAMPAKDVHLTVSYEPLDPDAYEITILDEDGIDSGYAQVDGVTVTGAVESKTVEIIAAAKIGYEFDRWEVAACDDASVDLENLLADPGKERTSFTMPAGAVTFTAHYKPIEPGEPSAPAQSGDMISKGEAAGTAVAAAAGAVGVGIAVWQGSELAMRIYRNKVIQIDYWPGNRIALAQLIWSRAGSPEPESSVPFADITEALDTLNDTNINAQKAARWCVEQGLLDAKTLDDGTECFEPMKHVTHLRVCITWQNARKMGVFDAPVETE